MKYEICVAVNVLTLVTLIIVVSFASGIIVLGLSKVLTTIL